MKILQNKKTNEIKIESQDYRDIVNGFMSSLQSVKSEQELMN
jgi:hypothetical protein